MSNLKKTGHTSYLLGVLSRLFVGILLAVALFSVFYTRAHVDTRVYAATSSNLNFQARLAASNGNIVPDGNYQVQFRLYNQVSGGAPLWTETYDNNTSFGVNSQLVRVVNGYMSVNLGSVTSFPSNMDWDQDLWLTMNVKADGEMTPRVKLTAVPYAFQAGTAKKLQEFNSGFTGTLGFDTLTGNRNILLPDENGTLCIRGSANCGFLTGTAADYIQNNTSLQVGANINIQARNSGVNGTTGMIVRGAADGQTVDLLQVQASNGTPLFVVSATGATTTTALTVGSGATSLGGTLAVTGGATFNGGLTIANGQNFIFNGDTFTDLTGSGLILSGGALTVDDSSVTGFIRNGGNSFGVPAVIGTNDANPLIFRVGGANQLTLTTGGNLEFQGDTSRTFSVGARTTNAAGSNLTISAGNAGAGALAYSGGSLVLQGGSAGGTGNASGGSVTIAGGAGIGTGTQGLVNLSTTAFSSAAEQVFSASGSITAGNVDLYSTIPVRATTANVTISVPDPAQSVVGRVLYITARDTSTDFTLRLNGARLPIDIAMKANSTATLIWNGINWTAAGASSSTDLQSAYNNTLTSAGGAEIILNPSGGNADGFTIRNNPTNPIMGPIFEVQSSIATNIFSVNNNAIEYATNGGAENAATFGTNWTAAPAGGTISRNTTTANVATGQASVQITTGATAGHGVRNNLSQALVAGTQYQVSFAGKLPIGASAFTSLETVYSRDGTNTSPISCSSNATLGTAGWTKITCSFTPTGTITSANAIFIRQTDATARTFFIDNLSVTLQTTTSSPPNVQIGGGVFGGAVTLLTLDSSSSPPVAAGNNVYYGSMYYDTTTGRIQCYEANGWGACGSPPDNIISLTPEYTGAVLNGTGVGTMTADFCANSAALTVGTLCAVGNSRQFYKWTSPQASMQNYSIYVSYKLPNTFKSFESNDTIRLTALTSSTTDGSVTYEVLRSTGSNITRCSSGSDETLVTTSANIWQTVPINGNENSGCGFSGGDTVIFKINVKARNNATVYVENLNFTFQNR